jgi:hypothetical protein
MYTLTGSSWLPIPSPEPSRSQKEPVLTQVTQDQDVYQSSHNEPISPINSDTRVKEFMDSNVESLLKEQIFLMKFILLFLGFMVLSNILSKKN